MLERFQRHWPEYAIEAAALATFMISACSFGVLLEYPGSPLHQAISNPALRRVFMGLAMGLTAVAIIYSPWGKQSGAHLNPSVTLTFLRLGKVHPRDAVFYMAAQFLGGVAGVALAAALLPRYVADPAVHYVATLPGPLGIAPAFAAETAISFLMMSMILRVSNTPALARCTGLFAGLLVWTCISLEAPVSGMSMNPALRLRLLRPRLDRPVGLLHRAAAGHAPRRRGLCPGPPLRSMRQAPPPEQQALHLL
jgi:aquaporin Z